MVMCRDVDARPYRQAPGLSWPPGGSATDERGFVAPPGRGRRRAVVRIRRRDDRATEADVAVVDDRRLPGGHGPLRAVEDELDLVRRIGASQRARRVRLAVARLRRVAAFGRRRAGDPAGVVGNQPARQQPGMVVTGNDVEDVAREVLARDEPGRVLAAGASAARVLEAADADALPLAERVERQADVLADGPAAVVLDRSRRVGEVAIEELAKRPFADEADAGRVLLPRVRQADRGGDPAHLGLGEVADREQRAR